MLRLNSTERMAGRIREVCEMGMEEGGVEKTKTYEEARKLLDEAWTRSAKVYKEAKEQADILYESARKLAVDKDARNRADEAHKEALTEAKRVRDAITNVAQSVFTGSWAQRDLEAKRAATELQERSDLAQKAYKEAREQANVVHKEAKKQAVDKQSEKAADEAHKEADRRAKKDYDDAMNK